MNELPRGEFAHYCIVRSDLPSGFSDAQQGHAFGESGAEWALANGKPIPKHTFAIVLAVKDEEHLRKISWDLAIAGIRFNLIIESDPPYSGQATAIGIWPTDRSLLRPILSMLPSHK